MNQETQSVDDYIGQIDPERRCTAREVVALMRSQLGPLDERIEWGTAIFSRQGKDITGVAIGGDHFDILVPVADVASEFSNKLGNVTHNEDGLRFRQLTDLRRSELKKLIDRLGQES